MATEASLDDFTEWAVETFQIAFEITSDDAPSRARHKKNFRAACDELDALLKGMPRGDNMVRFLAPRIVRRAAQIIDAGFTADVSGALEES